MTLSQAEAYELKSFGYSVGQVLISICVTHTHTHLALGSAFSKEGPTFFFFFFFCNFCKSMKVYMFWDGEICITLQRTQLQFPSATSGSSQFPVIPAPGD